jgi:valyl-tRNA synthetase
MTEPTQELAKAYDHRQVEEPRYQWWREHGYFKAPIIPGAKPYTIMIPPPNVTGVLHMGHGLNNTMIDVLIRYHRMLGRPTLYLPGTDHAGLATQIKVEENLRKTEGKGKHDLGREAFIDKVWEWKQKHGDHITLQLSKLGVSCDWERERFTMDEGLSKAVRAFFVRLYNKGLIYKGTRMTNWCPKDQTALSDIEVEYEEKKGHLWHLRYPLEDGSGELVVATTRPETMLGDTAVAVHPEDERYAHLIGKHLILPIMGRRIPIIADAHVEKEFGTGCVKVTPAHDPNDYDMGKRHNLEFIQVIGLDGKITAAGGKYQGLDRYECRKQLLADLEEQGYLVKVEDHTHNVGTCERCHSVIEPMITTQWFVKMQPLAEPAIKAVAEGEIKILPERFTKVYMHWLENIQDWCISRQIWWGHRIPVWYCEECSQQTCSMEDPTACAHCGSTRLEQDPDCLDTWFSSALWPFSTLGWPDEENPDYKYFYPNDVLCTGYDILFFWVARMIFAGIELTGKSPFHTVLLHGLIRDAQGRKYSKSLGNGVDPLDVTQEYGADALRYALCTGTSPGNDLKFRMERVEDARNFANKLWNASRFVLMNLADFDAAAPAEFDLTDRWIKSRLQKVIAETTAALNEYQLGVAAQTVRDFLWDEFCDWYIEMAKPRLYGKLTPAARRGAQQTLVYVLESTLRLLHPFMPFVTEEIWHKLPQHGPQVATAPAGAPASLMVTQWPAADSALIDDDAEARMNTVRDVARAIRNIRAEMNVPAGKKADVVLQYGNQQAREALEAFTEFFAGPPQNAEVKLEPISDAKPEKAAAAVVPGVEIYVPLAGLIDFDKEIERLQKEAKNAEVELEKTEKKLGNPNFIERAAPEAVEKERTKQAELTEKLQAIRARLAALGKA